MRLVIFIDEKNLFAGWRDTTSGWEINFRKLADWIVRASGETQFLGAYYYTGVDTAIPASQGQECLDYFLRYLADQPGYFVQRFQQRMRTSYCPQCGAMNHFTPSAPAASLSRDPEVHCHAFMEELHRATASMPDGHIGAHFFVTWWRSDQLVEVPDDRRRSISGLVPDESVEIYLNDDEVQAFRVRS